MIKNNSVCIVSDSYYPKVNAASLRNYYILLSIKKYNLNLTLLTNVNNPLPIVGINIIKLGCFKPAKLSSLIGRLSSEIIFSLSSLIYCLKNKYDIYFISSPSYFTLLFICPILYILNRKYIIDIRDLYPEALSAAGLINNKGLTYKTINLITKKIYKESFGIVTVTQSLHKYLEKFNKNCIISYNCSPRIKVNSTKKNKNEKFTVVMHGNFGRFQAIDVLIALVKAAENKGLNFVFIGYGLYFDRLVMHLSKLHYVAIYNTLNTNDLYQKLMEADIGLSLRDESEFSANSFPVRLWEYIGVGLPVVSAGVNNDGSLFVQQNQLGIISKCCPNDILEKILFCKDNVNYMRIFRSNILRLKDSFTREIESEKIVNFICESIKCVD